ncbi:hypothetical protein G6L60_25835 [Agrobacterium tumefaciens]|nr:hypothetical protein [Agrobacterium tumefaciens]
MVDEQTAASHSLACEAVALFELLDQFKFNDAAKAPLLQIRIVSPPAARRTRMASASPRTARGSAAVALEQADWQEF